MPDKHEKPLQLASSRGEDVYSKYIDSLAYHDDPITEEERVMVQRMIEEEMRAGGGEAPSGPALESLTPPSSSRNAIDTARYNIVDDMDGLDMAKVALEYEMGRRLEAQLRLKYDALAYRAGNEVRASVLRQAEEELRRLQGDVAMINRERKRVQGGNVKVELERMKRAYVELLGKNRRLGTAVEELESMVGRSSSRPGDLGM